MSGLRVHLAPGVPDPSALGLVDGSELLHPAPDGALAAVGSSGARAEVVAEEPGRTLVRYPLPGTPDVDGRVHERPRGAGTGWLWVVRYDERAPWRELARARLRAPRSASLAGHDWNLICHLRAQGLATPELVALVEEGAGPIARRSALVVRELDGWTRLDRWVAREHDPAAWRRAAGAVGRFAAGLSRAGVDLPELDPSDLWISPSEPGCGSSAPPGAALRVLARPAIALATVRFARFARGSPARTRRLLERLDEALGRSARVPERARLFAARRALGSARPLVAQELRR